MSDDEYTDKLQEEVHRISGELRKVCIEHQMEGALPEAICAALLQGATITAIMLATMANPDVSESESEEALVRAATLMHEAAWDAAEEFFVHFMPESEAVH